MTTVRRAGTVSATTVLGLILTIGLTHLVAPSWARGAGLDVWNLPNLMASARASDVDAGELRAQEDQLLREIELADHVAARLVAGSLSLAAATDEMEPILQNRPGFEMTTLTYYQTPTLHLAIARYLIARIERGIILEPSLRATALARLEVEYSQLK